MRPGLVLLACVFWSSLSFAGPRKDEPIAPIIATPITNKAAVALGKTLFFDPRLSKSSFLSCNSCHNLASGGSDNMVSSIGHKWNIGPINAPTVLNSRYNVAQFWDGRAKDLVDQAGGPVANPGEMGSTHELAVQVVASIPGYAPLFKAAFKDEQITMPRIQQAIAQFEDTLVTPNSRFDKWLAGDDKALDAKELAGYNLFKGRGCVGCHNGPAVGGSMYQKFGVVKAYETKNAALGRFAITKVESDRNVFKVPTLRNIELTYPYFHDGSVWTLEEAAKIMARHQLGVELTDDESTQIAAFLRTLTGSLADMTLPVLPPSGPLTPKPSSI